MCTPYLFCRGGRVGEWVGGGGGGGVEAQTTFSKGGLDRISVFREVLLGKRGVTFFKGEVQFLHKK